MNDLRFAFRQSLKNPGFTAVAVLTLALGIGANTVIFSVFNALMLTTLPVRNPEQLVMLWTRDGSRPRDDFTFYHPMFVKFRELNHVFSSVSASWVMDRSGVLFDGPGERVDQAQVHVSLVSGDYFSTLGINPALGRTLTPNEDHTLGAHPVVVISYDYWQRRFARAADVVGRTLKLIDTAYTIVGVAPRGFTGDWIGKPTTLALTRLISSRLFGVSPADPLTIVVATALMILVALLAGFLPARRAAKVHPMEALRYE